MGDLDKQMLCDEFIGEVIVIDRLRHFKIDASGDNLVLASVSFWKTTNDIPRSFYGQGRTMGLALRSVREKIRETYER